jgi:hypothetical protein
MNGQRIPRLSSQAWARARPALWPSLQAALAAAISWFIADRVLRNPQPFFAPIAAAITMGTTSVRRRQRVVQLVTGVLLGIAIAEALSAVLGTSTATLGLIVFVTFVVAKLTGEAFATEGMLFANQAAASAILVVTVHSHGIGADRALDALIGGGVAAIFGLLVCAPDPFALPRRHGGRGWSADATTARCAECAAPPEPEALSPYQETASSKPGARSSTRRARVIACPVRSRPFWPLSPAGSTTTSRTRTNSSLRPRTPSSDESRSDGWPFHHASMPSTQPKRALRRSSSWSNGTSIIARASPGRSSSEISTRAPSSESREHAGHDLQRPALSGLPDAARRRGGRGRPG